MSEVLQPIDRLRLFANDPDVFPFDRDDAEDVLTAFEDMRSGSTKAAGDVIAERRRQVEVEDFDASHDDTATRGQLVRAAVNYAAAASISIYLSRSHDYQDGPPFRESGQAVRWPWDETWWKPSNPRRDLVKAAALIIAEIERLDRLSPSCEGQHKNYIGKCPYCGTNLPDSPPIIRVEGETQ